MLHRFEFFSRFPCDLRPPAIARNQIEYSFVFEGAHIDRWPIDQRLAFYLRLFASSWQTFFTNIYCCVFSHRFLWYVSSWVRGQCELWQTLLGGRTFDVNYIISSINQYCSMREEKTICKSGVMRLWTSSFGMFISIPICEAILSDYLLVFFFTNFLKPKKVNTTTRYACAYSVIEVDRCAAHVWTAAVAAAITNTCSA